MADDVNFILIEFINRNVIMKVPLLKFVGGLGVPLLNFEGPRVAGPGILVHHALFHDEERYYIETSPLICGANQWTGFYMITASVIKELIRLYTKT